MFDHHVKYDNETGVEVREVSRAYFDKLVPFYVVEQSLRSCLCINCYQGKLAAISLCENWATLHGSPSGAACTCTCEFCTSGDGCGKFLPYTSPKTVFSMGEVSERLLCPPEFPYTTKDGRDVKAHRLACVSGHCPHCKRRQDAFFGCPLHNGDAERQLSSSSEPNTSSANYTQLSLPRSIQWREFTVVDDAASTRPTRRGRRGDDVDENDEDSIPSGGNNTKQRKVRGLELAKLLIMSRLVRCAKRGALVVLQ